MIASRALRAQAAFLLAADTTTLAAVAVNKMVLSKTLFTPSELIVLADITPADFDGSTPLDIATGTQPTAFDPNNADVLIDLKAPVGGFRWETTGVTNLPQTIFGYAILDNAGAVVLAAALLPSPITLTLANQRIDLGAPTIRQLANSMV